MIQINIQYMIGKEKISEQSQQEQTLTSAQSKQVRSEVNSVASRLNGGVILILGICLFFLFFFSLFHQIINKNGSINQEMKSQLSTELRPLVEQLYQKQQYKQHSISKQEAGIYKSQDQKPSEVYEFNAKKKEQIRQAKEKDYAIEEVHKEQIKEHNYLFIRHGESGFNQAWENLYRRKASYISYKQIRYNLSLVDVSITDKGINQAIQARQALKTEIQEQAIGIVLVSPLRRALQTCNIIFGERKGIKVMVEPLLGELMHASCDIGGRISESYQMYSNKFDFSKIPREKIRDNNWFIDLIKNEKLKSLIYEKKEREGLSFPQAAVELLKTESLQTTKQQRQRAKNLKEVLKELAQRENKKIALVGHGGIFGLLTADQFDRNDRPIVERQFKNSFPEQIIISLDKF